MSTEGKDDVRIDHRLSDKDSIFGRFSYNPTFNSQPALFPDVTVDGLKVSAGGGIFPGPSQADSQGYMADYVHIFRPNLVMELKLTRDEKRDLVAFLRAL